MHILNNEVGHNSWYGIDPHDDSNYMDIENNYVHDNGTHGIIMSRRCLYGIIRNNISINNGRHGIMLHRSSNDGLIEGNTVAGNGETGIALFESFYNTVQNNTITNNPIGIRFSMGAGDNLIRNNDISGSSQYAVGMLTGSDIPETNDGRPVGNAIQNNTIHDNPGYAIRISEGDNNTISGNNFYDNSSFLFAIGRGNVMSANTLPSDAFISNTGSPRVATTTTLLNQSHVTVQVDGNSTVTVKDSGGPIESPGVNGLTTAIDATGNTLVLNQAGVGSRPSTSPRRI